MRPRGRRVHLVEQSGHPAGTSGVQVVDAVRAAGP